MQPEVFCPAATPLCPLPTLPGAPSVAGRGMVHLRFMAKLTCLYRRLVVHAAARGGWRGGCCTHSERDLRYLCCRRWGRCSLCSSHGLWGLAGQYLQLGELWAAYAAYTARGGRRLPMPGMLVVGDGGQRWAAQLFLSSSHMYRTTFPPGHVQGAKLSML